MPSKRSASRGKKINPHFWVFCEGKTEESYIAHLRTKYRVSIEIISRTVGNKITERFIKEYKKGKPKHPKDKDFLMYDADVPEILEKLKKIQTAKLVASNPSIELWFLLHYKAQTATIRTEDCIRELINRNGNYRKGFIDSKLEKRLSENCQKACERAKQLKIYDNPSTNLHLFIKELESNKKVE
ncbi:RloB family protein [Arachidicoccus sp.]|uniref:RloB family protein n=1 Tax=Arachidicoccus sp. TaxID=1872624 RepID=UPI003D203318